MPKTLKELRQDVVDRRALLDNLLVQQYSLQTKIYEGRLAYAEASMALEAFEEKGEQNDQQGCRPIGQY